MVTIAAFVLFSFIVVSWAWLWRILDPPPSIEERHKMLWLGKAATSRYAANVFGNLTVATMTAIAALVVFNYWTPSSTTLPEILRTPKASGALFYAVGFAMGTFGYGGLWVVVAEAQEVAANNESAVWYARRHAFVAWIATAFLLLSLGTGLSTLTGQ